MPLEALRDIKALTFDVFGTVVNWRDPVQSALKESITSKAREEEQQPQQPAATTAAAALTDNDYADMAQEWRDSYKRFTRTFKAGETPWKDIDTHHHESLVALLEGRRLAGLYRSEDGSSTGEDDLRQLSLVWHRLDPWPDSARGLRQLGGGQVQGESEGEQPGLGLTTCTLSNGNRSLLADLDSHGNLGFTRLFSAEDFGAYKPDPRVYLGAAGALGVGPGHVAMVAAHLGDLDAARRLGMRTVYVEREGEEDWGVDEERYGDARRWVDLWVGLDGDGFLGVARALRSL